MTGRAVWVAVLLPFLVSCTDEASFPPSAVVIDVTMEEYGYVLSESTVSRGRTVFEVENDGELQHDLTLEALPEDFPPINDQLQSSTRRGAPTVAVLPAQAPTSTATFAADLVPGRYALVCFVTDDDGVQHSLKGMATEIRVES